MIIYLSEISSRVGIVANDIERVKHILYECEFAHKFWSDLDQIQSDEFVMQYWCIILELKGKMSLTFEIIWQNYCLHYLDFQKSHFSSFVM